MQPDPSGSAAEATAQDTTAEPSAAPDSGPTADGSLAVESQGDEAEATDQPTPESDDSAEDDGEDEGSEQPEQTEEQKRLSRRERQRLREQERINQAVEERIAAREREAQAAAATQEQQQAAQRAREAAAKEFAEYVGEEGESDRLSSEISDLNRQIRDEISSTEDLSYDEQQEKEKRLLLLKSQVEEKDHRLADIRRAQDFQDKIAQNLWNGIEAHVYSVLQWPEFAADKAAQSRYLGADGGIAGALSVAREVIRAAVVAEKDAEISKLKETHTSSLKAIESDRNAWRVRAGGSEVADTSAGGSPAFAGALTPEAYSRMGYEERQKLRSTPEGRRQIDEMTRRSGAA